MIVLMLDVFQNGITLTSYVSGLVQFQISMMTVVTSTNTKKTQLDVCCIVIEFTIMGADVLATQGASVSAPMILTRMRQENVRYDRPTLLIKINQNLALRL